MKKYEYKPRACRNCGRVFTPKNPLGTRRIGGRPSLYCSDTCRRKWRAEYKNNWSKEHYTPHIKQKRDREMTQLILNLELYDDMIKNLHYDINYTMFTTYVDNDRLERNISLINDLGLYDLKEKTQFKISDLDLKE